MLSLPRTAPPGANWPARTTFLLLVACTCLPAAATARDLARPQDPPTRTTEPAAPSRRINTPPAWLRGQLKSRYYLRWTGADSDNDLVETLVLDAGHEDRDRFTAHLMGRLSWDIDGVDPTFASINDSYGDRLDGLLYDAWVDIHRIDGLSLLRVGRQSVYETPEFAYFDGAHVTSAEFGGLALQAGGYLGSSTHLYESSKSGDLTAGVYLQARPWTDGRVRVDYMHLEDDNRLRTRDDDLLGAGFWQSFGRYLQLETQYSRIADRDRDVLARLTSRIAEWGLLAQGSFFSLLRTQGDLVLEADPFFNALNELRPYDQWSLLLAKDVTKELTLQAAGDLRRVHDRGDIGFYNRDYDHWYGTATLADFGVTGLKLSGTVDLWDASAQIVRSWGGDASWTQGATTASLGTYYSLFKFDLFTNSERDHVRTYYLRLRHEASKEVTFDGDFELEDDDFDQYHRFRLGVTWRF